MGLKKIRLGTRGSALALAQAELTEQALLAAHPELKVERIIIKTTGDRRTDVPLADVAKVEGHIDKGVFIKELEEALEYGDIDVAVHSLKDVPSEVAPGFTIAAVLPRAQFCDILVTKSSGGLKGLGKGAKVATSSSRRKRQILHLRPDLDVVEIRGNVPTRLRKLAESDELEGLLLAEAGIRRLNLLDRGKVIGDGFSLNMGVFDPKVFLPSAGQGAVGLEIRDGAIDLEDLLAPLNHEISGWAVDAEREFLRLLGAGCDTPVGVYAVVTGTSIVMRARVFDEDDLEAEPVEGMVRGYCDDIPALAARLKKEVFGEA
jgi:hydroxymethylbilane synthase